MATLKDLTVPDIGDFDEVPIIEVFVSAGDQVAENDPLLTLESDKATMDVPAPFAGLVAEILVEVGDTVSQGSLLMRLEVEAESGAETESGAEAAPEAAPAPEADPPVGATPPTGPVSGRIANEKRPSPGSEQHGSGQAAPEPPGQAPHASPIARRVARELGVDLGSLAGSGRRGRIVREDVEAAARSGTDGGGLDLAPWPDVDFEQFGPIEIVELPRIRKIAARHLARNWVQIPHVTHHDEADITAVEEFRKALNSEQDVKVTMLALILKACAATLAAFPEFNSSLAGERLVLKRYFHLGFAADTSAGLVVPVIRYVDRKGLLEIAAELRELSETARAGKLSPAQMQGASFTVSSLGGIGGIGFTPIINAPEVAILGVSRAATKPVWDGERFEPRLLLPLSLSYDHRVIDGAAAARFAVRLAGLLADMRRVLL